MSLRRTLLAILILSIVLRLGAPSPSVRAQERKTPQLTPAEADRLEYGQPEEFEIA